MGRKNRKNKHHNAHYQSSSLNERGYQIGKAFQNKGKEGWSEGIGKMIQCDRKNLTDDLNKRGLFIRSIVPDGNCLFRSCADQLFGEQERHSEVRRNAIEYIRNHKEDYIPFMDVDQEPFYDYIGRMSHSGSWGGDLEINAISNCYKCNVIVFQDERPNLELQSFPNSKITLQLAYFGYCHYNSVRGSRPVVLSHSTTHDNIVIRADDISESKVEKKKKTKVIEIEKPSVVVERKAITSSPKTKKISIISLLSLKERNIRIIRHMERRFTAHQQICLAKRDKNIWSGDLPFRELVTPEMQEKLLKLRNERQLRGTLRFLTMKCGCKSDSYFKYCCYPKMKACINRKRYYISKLRV